MKPVTPTFKNTPAVPKTGGKMSNASQKNLHTSTQNPNRLKIVKAVNAGHVRGGHAFH